VVKKAVSLGADVHLRNMVVFPHQRDFTPLELLEDDDASKEAVEIRAILLNPSKYCKQPPAPTRPAEAASPQSPTKATEADPQRSLLPQPMQDGDKQQEQVFEINDNEPL